MKRFFKYPWMIIALVTIITVFFAFQLRRAEVDNNNFRFVPANDPARLLSKKIDDTFGSQVFILVGLHRPYDSVLDADFLKTLRTYTEEIKKLPMVDKVESIVSSDYITGTSDSIVVESLVPKDFSGTTQEVETLKGRLLSWDLYRRGLISEDLQATQVLITLKITMEDAGKSDVMDTYHEIQRLARQASFKGTSVYYAGLPVLSVEISQATSKDLRFLIPLVILVVMTVLALSFRRLKGVLLPLLTVLISTIWAMGAMPLVGIRLSILSTVLPVILMAVGSAYGIHVVSHYFDEIAAEPNLSREEFENRLFVLLRRVGRPVFLAALTTFVGFVSFCFTTVVPIFEFGLFSSFGVIAAFIVSVTFIPALLLILGPEKQKAAEGKEKPFQDPLSDLIADTFTQVVRKRRTIVLLSGVLLLVSLAGLSKLVVDNVLVEYFKPTTEVARSDRFIRENFGGSKVVSVVVSSPVKGRVLKPDVLGPLDGLETYLTGSVPEVGKVMGFTDLIKRINQVFNVDAPPGGLAALPSPPAPASQPAKNGTPTQEGSFGFGFADTGTPDGGPPSAGVARTGSVSPTEPQGSLGTKGPSNPPLTDQGMADLLSRALDAGTFGTPTADRIIKNLYRLVNYHGYGYYEIPVDPRRYGKTSDEELQNLVSNYLVLLSGNISSYADDPLEPKAIRLNILLRTVGQIDTNRAIEAINRYVADRFPQDVKVDVGGTALVERSLNNLVVQSQLVSILISIFLVFLILAIYYRSIIAGLIGLTPLSISVLINFAVMGFVGIKLNIGTALVASVSVGIGIDYTIHYMAAYHHEYLATQGRGDFIRKTFYSSGKAIIFNALSVGAGFAVLMLSQFVILEDLGLLIALTMGTSALIALTLLPVLLDWIKPSFIKRPLASDAEEGALKNTVRKGE